MTSVRQTLFRQGDAGYYAFRIPTVITLKSGRVLAFCEARRNSLSDAGSIDIVVRRGDGRVFDDLQVVVHGGRDTVGNPCPVQDPATGRLFLLFNKNDGDKPEDMILRGEGPRTVHMTRSDDEGLTWTVPVDITRETKLPDWTWYAIGPCHGAVLSDGRLAFGCNHAVLNHETRTSGPYTSHLIYSEDHGATWHIGPDQGPGTNECSLAAFPDGGVLINMRYISYAPEEEYPYCRAQAYSEDAGRSFSETVFRRELTDPQCQGSILTVGLNGREAVLLSNAASHSRDHLTVRISYDRGENWEILTVAEPGPSAYSDMTQLPDGSIGVLFENGKQSAYEKIDWMIWQA